MLINWQSDYSVTSDYLEKTKLPLYGLTFWFQIQQKPFHYKKSSKIVGNFCCLHFFFTNLNLIWENMRLKFPILFIFPDNLNQLCI